MEYSVIMSGFGGQGVLMMGELLAFCAMKAGLNVTWMPAYGVEMRGGAANCTVVLSEEKIGAPLTGKPAAVIAMSEPALNKFASWLQDEGLLMINSSLIRDSGDLKSNGLRKIEIPTLSLASEIGNEKMANLTMLGAFMACSGIINLDEAVGQIEHFLPESKKKLAPEMEKALYKGKDYLQSL